MSPLVRWGMVQGNTRLPKDHHQDPKTGKPPKPQADRAEVLRWAKSVGPTEASMRFGVSIRTIARWKAEAVQLATAESTMPSGPQPWLERREALGDRFGEIASDALELAAQYIREADGNNAQKALVSAGIATDKAQLLRGGPTKRSEHTVSLDAQVTRLMDALGAIKERPGLPVAGEVLDLESDVVEAEVVEREEPE